MASDAVATSGCPAMAEMNEQQVTLFHKLGGHAAVKAAVDVFYTRILADTQLAPFFEGIEMKAQRRKQALFMTYVFGGAANYKGRDLYTVHKRLIDEKGMNESHFQLVADHLGSTLKELGIAQELVDEVLVVVGSTKPLIFGKV